LNSFFDKTSYAKQLSFILKYYLKLKFFPDKKKKKNKGKRFTPAKHINSLLETNNQNGGYKKINEKKRKRNTKE
jgi:hypothetical protein